MEQEIGKVIRYYSKAEVAVVKLSGSLKVGDAIKVKKGENEFSEVVESMQVEHQPIASAQSGQEVAVKVSQKTKEGAQVFKVEE